MTASTTTIATTTTTVTHVPTSGSTAPPTTTTLAKTTTTTTLVAAQCGNGVIDVPFEQCDGDAVCDATCFVKRYACCQYGGDAETCAANVPPFVLMTYQYGVCGAYGGTFMHGTIATGAATCPTDAARSQGPCVPAPPLPAPVTVCCQRAVDACDQLTTAANAELDPWYYVCAAQTYARFPASIVVGTCGADGQCTPAH